jgi:lactoylglutathione lyase
METMRIEHIAIWTRDIEKMKAFYVDFFDAISNEKYSNPVRKFESYFLSFRSGCRLELMQMPGIMEIQNPGTTVQHYGLIHIAFGVESMGEVDAKAKELSDAGYPILSGPRKTGDAYYEFETLDPEKNRIELSTVYGRAGN